MPISQRRTFMTSAVVLLLSPLFAQANAASSDSGLSTGVMIVACAFFLLVGLAVATVLTGFVRLIPNNRVGIIEKLWSPAGSVPEGCIMALNGEAGFQAELLRGGLHFGFWTWQYRIHKVSLVT